LGNVIKPDALEKIQLGMKKSEIKPILGSPMLTDPFHANRWDYIYRYLPRGRTSEALIESRVTLYFEDDVLVRIDDSDYVEPRPDDEKEE
jgi:outer membrane protein assembly factor BamE